LLYDEIINLYKILEILFEFCDFNIEIPSNEYKILQSQQKNQSFKFSKLPAALACFMPIQAENIIPHICKAISNNLCFTDLRVLTLRGCRNIGKKSILEICNSLFELRNFDLSFLPSVE